MLAEAAKEIRVPADGGASALLAWPHAPGEAPFRVKGNAYRGHMEYVAREVPGGIDAQRAAIQALHPEHGPRWAEWLDQTFMASGWYDCHPLAIAGIACGQLTGKSFLQFVEDRAVYQASIDVKGIHKFLLKFVSAKSIAIRVPALTSQYFDFVVVDSKVPDESKVICELIGIPVALAPWWSTIAKGYIRTVTELAGNRTPNIKVGPYLESGQNAGVDICTVHTIVELPG